MVMYLGLTPAKSGRGHSDDVREWNSCHYRKVDQKGEDVN